MLDFIKSLFKSKTDMAQLVKNGAVIVDVRTPSEYKAGHISGSKNIPLDSIRQEIKRLQSLNAPIITVCRSGNRSGMAKSILAAANIEVYNGGAWSNLKKQIK
ncbi:rhodanese-like domain-containing protein [Aridibaculum aurantiacum]|uniref:rhodanese-like domain-containing protein n=1 Tax=Aridibaculum aurantiacum TaxID=2810307 RepID=UPI001A959A95|nr:rhodanese-like domain-containing protein [Aridibaculum aurantiacum]